MLSEKINVYRLSCICRRFEAASSNDRVVGWWNPANRLALKDLGDTPLSGDPPSPYIIGGCKF